MPPEIVASLVPGPFPVKALGVIRTVEKIHPELENLSCGICCVMASRQEGHPKRDVRSIGLWMSTQTLFQQLDLHIMFLREWRSLFTFKTIQGFGLYKV